MRNKYRTLIISCWSVLLICFVIKFLGGNLFEIVCKNKNFINFCNLFTPYTIPYFILTYITNTTIVLLINMAMLKLNKPTMNLFLMITLLFIIRCASYYLFNNQIIYTIIDLFMFCGIPLIVNRKFWKRIISGLLLVLLFQVISLITKNLGLHNIDENVITSMIFMFDYYIMVILYYLYSIKEGGGKDGIFWRIFSRNKRQ